VLDEHLAKVLVHRHTEPALRLHELGAESLESLLCLHWSEHEARIPRTQAFLCEVRGLADHHIKVGIVAHEFSADELPVRILLRCIQLFVSLLDVTFEELIWVFHDDLDEANGVVRCFPILFPRLNHITPKLGLQLLRKGSKSN
jgi:hypothetical protein